MVASHPGKTIAKLRTGPPNAIYRVGDPLTLPPGWGETCAQLAEGDRYD